MVLQGWEKMVMVGRENMVEREDVRESLSTGLRG